MQLVPSNRAFPLAIHAFFIFVFVSVFMAAKAEDFSIGNEPIPLLLKTGNLAPINVLKNIYNEEKTFPVLERWNIVFYWSLFCHSCVEEIPEVQKKLSELDKDIEVYLISLDSEKMQNALKNFAKRRKITAQVLMEKTENEKYLTADTWGVSMTPSVFVVNPEGIVVFSHQGPLDLNLFFKNLPKELSDTNEANLGNKNG